MTDPAYVYVISVHARSTESGSHGLLDKSNLFAAKDLIGWVGAEKRMIRDGIPSDTRLVRADC